MPGGTVSDDEGQDLAVLPVFRVPGVPNVQCPFLGQAADGHVPTIIAVSAAINRGNSGDGYRTDDGDYTRAMTTPRARYLLATLGIPVWVPRVPSMPAVTPAWTALATAVAGCTRCGLHHSRTQTVFGSGDPRARWLFIGEAPGAEEDRQGVPFVGRAGQLLAAMLSALGLTREQVFIANVLKCRPPHNRDPLPAEVSQCRPYLEQQIALIAPRLIIALGKVAAQSLLGTDRPLHQLRGAPVTYAGIPVVVTYHPAYLLRAPADKAKAWADLQRARRLDP